MARTARVVVPGIAYDVRHRVAGAALCPFLMMAPSIV